MKKYFLLIVIVLACLFEVKAQDPHFSQQFDNPLYLNPAQSGNGVKLNRLVFNYRDQWRTVPSPFSSTFISYDRKLMTDEKQSIGGGIQLLYDRSGDGHLATVQTSILPSYTRSLVDGKYLLSVGLQLGLINRFIKTEELIFENEGENITGSNIKLDLGFGAEIKTFIGDKKHPITGGFAMHNLTRPDLALIEGSTNKRPIRYNAYVTSEVFLTNGWSINPVMHLQFQEKSNDILPLVFARKQLKPKTKEGNISMDLNNPTDSVELEKAITERKMAFSFGTGYRFQDALMLYGAWELDHLKIGFSYDINTSALKEATSSFGAVELLVKYEFGNKKVKPEPVITYDTLFILDTINIDTILIQEEEVITQETEVIQEINRGLAVSMYFPNDYPNPNSRDTVTDMTYAEVYKYYAGLTSKHPILAAFIEEFVIPDQKRYRTLLDDLVSILESGKRVSLDIRGYASSLATSDYNLNLSKRRVDAVVNDFKDDPRILKFIENGMLKINRLPYGDTQAEDGIDDSTDLVKSVYGKKASRERRVEIESIKIE